MVKRPGKKVRKGGMSETYRGFVKGYPYRRGDRKPICDFETQNLCLARIGLPTFFII